MPWWRFRTSTPVGVVVTTRIPSSDRMTRGLLYGETIGERVTLFRDLNMSRSLSSPGNVSVFLDRVLLLGCPLAMAWPISSLSAMDLRRAGSTFPRVVMEIYGLNVREVLTGAGCYCWHFADRLGVAFMHRW